MRNKFKSYQRCGILILAILFSVQVFAQKTVSGIVTDEATNEALIGVAVTVKNKTTGTVTDIDGKYSINVLPTDVLQFSYIGYEKKEITVANNTTLNVKMSSNALQLQEVVAIGYGVVKKSDITGSVAVVST
jgi:hypothetical protein